MAVPRILISSTCYDLQEIRYNLRNFISSFAYEPVNSEFGDIFYEFDKHVQDSCIKEIEKCQMYILIIGNKYGSTYYKTEKGRVYPDSVTLKEFSRSIETDIPKYIFVEKFVDHDYVSYRKALEKDLKSYFEKKDIKSEEEAKKKSEGLRKEFDEKYPFLKNSYKYIFYFLDIIYGLKVNNARFVFENFENIKEQLKKQWAGFMYNQLVNERLEKSIDSSNKYLKEICDKVDKIDKMLRTSFIEDRSKDKEDIISFDVKKIKKSIKTIGIEKSIEILDNALERIVEEISTGSNLGFKYRRGTITEEITRKKIIEWLGNIEDILKKYKWSKTISFTELFSNFSLKYYKNINDTILRKDIEDIYNIYMKVPSKDINSFASSVQKKIEILYEKTSDGEVDSKSESVEEFKDEDIPF